MGSVGEERRRSVVIISTPMDKNDFWRRLFLQRKESRMDEKMARELLGSETIRSDEGLHDINWYLEWLNGKDYATLDGTFEAEELEAIAWWMKNKGK